MDNNIKVESWNGHQIRFVWHDGEWWAVLKQRIEELEKRVAELEKAAQPRKFNPEDSDNIGDLKHLFEGKKIYPED